MEFAKNPEDDVGSAAEYTDDLTPDVSDVSTPVNFSTNGSPTLQQQSLPADPITPTQKKKKKKKSKKSSKVKESPGKPSADAKDSDDRPAVLCISRNKHWRYISSYHGPWLQLPVELLESLLVLNLDPAMPTGRLRNLPNIDDYSPPHSPRPLISSSLPVATIPRNPGKPTPPPIDPGVLRSVTRIRRLIDEAAELSVRASSGLSAVELGSMRNTSSFNGSSWAAAQTLGLNPNQNTGNGRHVGMSANRIHRLRSLAVQKLAQAYKLDEIASSVMVMQGGSVFDDVAERVLKYDPHDPDAKYVHFFHEKIPSRQLAESTTTRVLDELIAAYPQRLEYYRTRGVVHCFRDEYAKAAKDFTHALKEARVQRKSRAAHRTSSMQGDSRHTKGKKRKGINNQYAHQNGHASPEGNSILEGMSEGPDGEHIPVHPSISPDAPEPIEIQLLFLRGATYLQHAVHLIENSILEIEGIKKPSPSDGTELRLCYLEQGRFGGVEIGNPDGPLGKRDGAKVKAYREVLAAKEYKEHINGLLKKSIRDHEKFLSHFDASDLGGNFGTGTGVSSGSLPEGDIASQVEYAFLLSESVRPGNHNNAPPPNLAETPPAMTTYHPLLVESHFSVLICYLLLADFAHLLPLFARTAILVDGVEGYPIFLPPRSMGQAEFIEVLERLASGWKNGTQLHSLSAQRGKSKLAIEHPLSLSTPPLLGASISISSTISTSSTITTVNPGINNITSPSSVYYDYLTNIGEQYASSSSASVSRRSSRDALRPAYTSPPPYPNGHDDHDNPECYRPDASQALDCARILLAPVVKRQKVRAEQAAADKAVGVKKKPASINIPLHGPRVEIILGWLGAVHLPELDGA